jgi:hypothetical protein
MKWRQPALITLEGESIYSNDYAELLGIDEDDAELLGNCGSYLSGEDIAYLNAKYPEYMGIWPLIAKAGALLAKGGVAIGKGIAGAVKKARERRAGKKEDSKVAEMQRQMVAQQQALLAQQQAKAAQQKKLLMIGLPIAAVALFAIMSMNKAPAPAAAPAQRGKGGKK